MRLKEITAAHRRLLGELAGKISNRLEASFADPAEAESPNIGVRLNERGKRGALEVPETLLLAAASDAAVRHALGLRIKSARDRMLFKPPPERPRADIAPAGEPFFQPRGGGARRGRR